MVLWKWGPVTQYMIDLKGVDSAGEQKGEDVMELVGQVTCAELRAHVTSAMRARDLTDGRLVGQMNAIPETQQLLLDSVMNGFVYQLFAQKASTAPRR